MTLDYTGHTVVDGELHHASVSSVKAFDIRTKGGCPRRWAYSKVFGNKADAFMNVEAKDKGAALDKELKHYLRTGDKSLSSLALKGLHILEAPGADLGLDIAINTVEHHAPNGARLPSLPDGERHPDGTRHIVKSALTAAGVPFVGELDGAHARGHFRDDDGEYHDDPPGTVEVFDIKFKTNATDRNGNSLYFLPTDMIRDVQMAGYGEWVRRVRPETTHVRLSMLYFPEKKGLPTKVTRLHVLEDFPKAWAHTETVVREMKDVARATDIEQVPGAPDISTCDAYSGCPHREYCTAYRRNSLDKTYGKIAEDHVADRAQQALARQEPGQEFGVQQGLPQASQGQARADVAPVDYQVQVRPVDGAVHLPVPASGEPLRDLPRGVYEGAPGVRGSQPLHGQGASAPVSDLQSSARTREGTTANTPGGRGVFTPVQLSSVQGMNQMGLLTPMNQPQAQPQVDMRAQLAAEEAQQRTAVAQQQQQMPQQLDTQALLTVCLRLQGYGYGFPTLAGNAAQAYAVAGGQSVAPGVTYPGVSAFAGARRSLHGVQLTEVAHIYQLEGELASELAASQPTPAAPPVMMQSTPLAPQMQTMQSQPTSYTQAPNLMPPGNAPALSFLPPDAPQSMPQLAMQGGPQQVQHTGHAVADLGPRSDTQMPPAEAPPKAKSPGRPKKVQDAAPGSVAASAPASPPPQPAPASQAAPVSVSPFPTETNPAVAPSCTILVNARSARNDTKSLNDYVDYINRTAAERYNVSADGRKGLLDVRAGLKDTCLAFGGWPGVVRELVKADPPPEGRWHLDTNMDGVAEAVADALRVVADVKGWDYFRGMRG